jgi:hypothetical protein
MTFSNIKHGRRQRWFLAAAMSAFMLTSCQKSTLESKTAGSSKVAKEIVRSPEPSSPGGGAQYGSGRALAERWCGNCHLLPDPGDLPRERWPFVIKWMGNYLGHPYEQDDVKKLIYPTLVATKPFITREELAAIQDYYVSAAPKQVEPAFPRDRPLPITSLFKPQRWPGYPQPSRSRWSPSTPLVGVSMSEPPTIHSCAFLARTAAYLNASIATRIKP